MKPLDYSKEEHRLFQYFGFDDLTATSSLFPYSLYAICVEKAFAEGLEGPAIEALRRAIVHLRAYKFRMTDEFNALISF